MNPPSGLESTPPRGFPYLTCPHCGGALPRVAFPAEKARAQKVPTPPPADVVAPELVDLTPITGQPIDRRIAPTERLEQPDQEPG